MGNKFWMKMHQAKYGRYVQLIIHLCNSVRSIVEQNERLVI